MPDAQPRTERLTFRLTLRAAPSNVPAVVRLRRLIKLARRVCGLRAIEAQQVRSDGRGDGLPADGPR